MAADDLVKQGARVSAVQVGVSLHLASPQSEFSRGCKFVDCVSIISDM